MPIFEIGVKKILAVGNNNQIKQLYCGLQHNHGLAAQQLGRMSSSGPDYLLRRVLSELISGAELRQNGQSEGDCTDGEGE